MSLLYNRVILHFMHATALGMPNGVVRRKFFKTRARARARGDKQPGGNWVRTSYRGVWSRSGVAKVHFKYYEARTSNVKLTNYEFSPLVRQIHPFSSKLETLIGIIAAVTFSTRDDISLLITRVPPRIKYHPLKLVQRIPRCLWLVYFLARELCDFNATFLQTLKYIPMHFAQR